MTAPERRGPERPGPDYPPEWDREPADESLFDTCERCEGDGGWSESYYDAATGRELDADVNCNECGGSGVL